MCEIGEARVAAIAIGPRARHVTAMKAQLRVHGRGGVVIAPQGREAAGLGEFGTTDPARPVPPVVRSVEQGRHAKLDTVATLARAPREVDLAPVIERRIKAAQGLRHR